VEKLADREQDWEFGIRTDGHGFSGKNTSPVILGENSFQFRASGDNWGKLPEGWQYKEGTAVAVDSRDQIYVFNRGTCPMIVLNPDGDILRTWGEGVFTNPHGVTIAPDDTVFCVDNGDSTVRRFSPTGELLMTLGTPNQPSPKMSGEPFCVPAHVAFDKRTGDFYVADGYSNARVHKFSPSGKLLFSWGESGTGKGQFNIVHNIVVDNEGWVYVADRENHRIQIFSSDGKYETQWGDLSRVAAICIDDRSGEELVYIGEYFCGIATNDIGSDLGPRVTIMDTKGNVLARVGRESYGEQPGRFYSPHGIAVDSKGDIYVAEVSWTDYGRHMDPPRELRSMQKLVRVSD
jgi:DNA-binding beta-propeller fold protein YncE